MIKLSPSPWRRRVVVVVFVVVTTTCVVVGAASVVVGFAGVVVVVVVFRRRVVVVFPVVVVVTVSPGCVDPGCVVVVTTVVDVVTDPAGHSSNFRGTHTSLIQSKSTAGVTPCGARAEKRTFSRPGRRPCAATAKSTKSVRIGPLMSRGVGVAT